METKFFYVYCTKEGVSLEVFSEDQKTRFYHCRTMVHSHKYYYLEQQPKLPPPFCSVFLCYLTFLDSLLTAFLFVGFFCVFLGPITQAYNFPYSHSLMQAPGNVLTQMMCRGLHTWAVF